MQDKYFAWEATVEAITGVCGKSSLAIFSRWRDRDFGQAERILPIAVNFLVSRGDLDPKVALALIGFRAYWNEPFLLKNFLDTSTDEIEKKVVVEFAYRYMILNGQSARKWRELKSILDRHEVVSLDLDERIAFSECEEQSLKASESSYAINHDIDQENKYDWDTIFDGIDLSVANDVSQAYRRFRSADPLYYQEQFFAETKYFQRYGDTLFSQFISASG